MVTVTLLWSGGWDGTFRFLQLASKEICIQPIYVIDKARKSREYEKAAMHRVVDIVSTGEEYNFKATILPIKFYTVEWILQNCADEKISAAFRYLKEKYSIGTQYEWFALLAKKLGVKLETCVVHQYHGKVEDAIRMEGMLSPTADDIFTERYQVLPKGESRAAAIVFENLLLPTIQLSKKDEERIAGENGWLDIMKLSWFCHNPDKNGNPCGLCGPCDDAMHTGMEWRLPRKAQQRNKHRYVYLLLQKARRSLVGERKSGAWFQKIQSVCFRHQRR
ncbi:MAG TPA: hypothetical protein P5075_06200 [Eubacteriales bacterium]|nr:hypothetical protein [Eubacteriales bacterium]